MSNNKLPTYGNGKICYVEIPAIDIAASSSFYHKTFGWKIRQRGDGATSFDDIVNEVSGAWVTGRTPTTEAGVLIYIMVDDINKSIEAVIANGGRMVQKVGVEAPEITARFADPAGNIFGLYQEPDK